MNDDLQPIQIKNWSKCFQLQLPPTSKRQLSRLKSLDSQEQLSEQYTKINKTKKFNKNQERTAQTQYGHRTLSFKTKQQSQQKNYQIKTPLYLQLVPFFRVSAQSWAIFNGITGEYITGYNQHKCRQIASITKIITCILSIKMAEELNLNIDQKRFFVPEQAQKIGGTTAGLIKGDSILLRDLLYGLMLPSGNDAALTLAYNFQLYSLENEHFLKQMNKYIQNLGLSNTQFSNVHGLFNENNFSTAYDVGKFTFECLQNEQFLKIVRTHSYFCFCRNQLSQIDREFYWENTNKLLLQGFSGVKTGVTKEAGPSVVEFYQDEQKSYIIVLLNCTSSESRWMDALKLLQWIQKQDTLIKQFII